MNNPLFESPVAYIFYPQYVQEQFEQMSQGFLSGDDPAEFAKRMCIDWMFGERRTFADDERVHGFFLTVTISDLPEGLRRGLGRYEAAIIRNGEVDLHESKALARLEWDRTFIETDEAEENPDE